MHVKKKNTEKSKIMYYKNWKGNNTGWTYVLRQTNDKARIKKIMPKNSRQKHWRSKKEHFFLLMKGKIQNKEIRYL